MINILKDDLFKNKRNYKKPGERRERGRNLKKRNFHKNMYMSCKNEESLTYPDR
jgi:hypothetical protein